MTAIDLEELRQKNAAKALEEERKQTEEEGTPVTTAFVVVQSGNGQWTALTYDQAPKLLPERQATLDDITGGSAAIQAGCVAQQTAFQTMVMMQQQAQQMQAQMANQRIASQIDPSKLRNN